MGKNRRSICGAVPEWERESGKTVEIGIRIVIDTEAVWLFRQGIGGTDTRKSILPILYRVVGIPDESAICSFTAG